MRTGPSPLNEWTSSAGPTRPLCKNQGDQLHLPHSRAPFRISSAPVMARRTLPPITFSVPLSEADRAIQAHSTAITLWMPASLIQDSTGTSTVPGPIRSTAKHVGGTIPLAHSPPGRLRRVQSSTPPPGGTVAAGRRPHGHSGHPSHLEASHGAPRGEPARFLPVRSAT